MSDAPEQHRDSTIRIAAIILGALALITIAFTATGVGADSSKLTDWQALVLGTVQGFTEFLPISSSGHLILVPWLFNWHYLGDHPGFDKTFDVSLHLGTLIAVVVYFHSELWVLLKAWAGSVKRRSISTPDERLGWFILVATIPAALAGALGESFFERELGQPWQIAIFMAAGALLLFFADRTAVTRKMEQLGLGTAFVVGVAQVLSLMPGVSRSGITISAGRFLGLSRDDAAKFSFYLYTPIVGGAVLYKSLRDLRHGFPPGTTGPFVIGTATSAIVGMFAIWALLAYLRNNSYTIFVVYRLVLALLVLLVIAAGLKSSTF